MTRYVGLIRGINVGGNNKVSMSELKSQYELSGLKNVSTYINSGNVIFESDELDTAKLVSRCETIIRDCFGVTMRMAVISVDELHKDLAHAPAWWGADEGSKHNAVFVIPPAQTELLVREVGEIKPEYEKIAFHGHIIFWSAPLKTFGRSRWAKIVGAAAYQHVTIRNYTTAQKLKSLTE
ncbi:MAG: hypothetical protein JWN33_505 [Candidatus Saccharibacteria bacterium]|nr:hypothetical protein [Candidatus Saccharibacteria bacterium]